MSAVWLFEGQIKLGWCWSDSSWGFMCSGNALDISNTFKLHTYQIFWMTKWILSVHELIEKSLHLWICEHVHIMERFHSRQLHYKMCELHWLGVKYLLIHISAISLTNTRWRSNCGKYSSSQIVCSVFFIYVYDLGLSQLSRTIMNFPRSLCKSVFICTTFKILDHLQPKQHTSSYSTQHPTHKHSL